MTFTIELYSAAHLVDCHQVQRPTGVDAVRAAEEDLEWWAADRAEVFASDGCGGRLYYTTVRVAPSDSLFQSGVAYYATARRGEDGDW